MPNDPESFFLIRTFRPEDADACRHLYVEGLIGGKLADNDTGYDIDDIPGCYLRHACNHFWVAQLRDGKIVGMIGVQQHDAGVGEIRRLRVAAGFRRRGIGSALIRTALQFCQEHQYIKIELDSYVEREPALRLFEKFRFRHERTRDINGKSLMYFYLDFYRREQDPHREGAD